MSTEVVSKKFDKCRYYAEALKCSINVFKRNILCLLPNLCNKLVLVSIILVIYTD